MGSCHMDLFVDLWINSDFPYLSTIYQLKSYFLWSLGWNDCSGDGDGLVPKLSLTLLQPRDYSMPESSVHGTSQAKILEWVAISFSRRYSPPRDRTQVYLHCRWILLLTEPPGKPNCNGRVDKTEQLHKSSLSYSGFKRSAAAVTTFLSWVKLLLAKGMGNLGIGIGWHQLPRGVSLSGEDVLNWCSWYIW